MFTCNKMQADDVLNTERQICLENVGNYYCHLFHAPDNNNTSLKGSHRLLKILRVLFMRRDLKTEHYQQISTTMRSMYYQPPWDGEGVIGMYQRRILKLISENFANDESIQHACELSLDERPTFKEEIALMFPSELQKYNVNTFTID
jgi:hypothetical protein